MAGPVQVFGIGHSNQSFERFVELLERNGVACVADVRRVPKSRTVPWAWGEQLAMSLPAMGVAYVHIPELAGLRKPRPDSVNTAWRNDSFRAYADHMQTPEFEQGVRRLLAEAALRPTAMMCAEAVPWRCHRSLVADALVARGVDVLQILSPTRTEPHRMTAFAKVEDGNVTYPGEPREGGRARRREAKRTPGRQSRLEP